MEVKNSTEPTPRSGWLDENYVIVEAGPYSSQSVGAREKSWLVSKFSLFCCCFNQSKLYRMWASAIRSLHQIVNSEEKKQQLGCLSLACLLKQTLYSKDLRIILYCVKKMWRLLKMWNRVKNNSLSELIICLLETTQRSHGQTHQIGSSKVTTGIIEEESHCQSVVKSFSRFHSKWVWLGDFHIAIESILLVIFRNVVFSLQITIQL